MVLPAPWSLPRKIRFRIVQELRIEAARAAFDQSQSVQPVSLIPKRATPMSQPYGR